LVLAGQPGSGSLAVAHAMAARSGLPLFLIDRWIENHAGRSLAHLLAAEGSGELEAEAAKGLAAGLRRRPHAIIALEGAGLSSRPADDAENDAVWIHIRRSPEELLERIRRQLDARAGSLPNFPFGAPGCVRELQPILQGREALLGAADAVIDAEGREALSIAREILASLDRITGTRRV